MEQAYNTLVHLVIAGVIAFVIIVQMIKVLDRIDKM